MALVRATQRNSFKYSRRSRKVGKRIVHRQHYHTTVLHQPQLRNQSQPFSRFIHADPVQQWSLDWVVPVTAAPLFANVGSADPQQQTAPYVSPKAMNSCERSAKAAKAKSGSSRGKATGRFWCARSRNASTCKDLSLARCTFSKTY